MRLPLLAILLALPAFALPAFDWDLARLYPDASAALSTSQSANFAEFDSRYTHPKVSPNGAGLNATEIEELGGYHTEFRLARDANGDFINARSLVIDGEYGAAQEDISEPASYYGDFLPTIRSISQLYARAAPEQEQFIRDLYRDMIENYLDQNVLPGGVIPPWLGNGYAWRNIAYWPLAMADTLDTETRDLLGLSLFFYSGGHFLTDDDGEGPDRSLTSTDISLNFLRTGFKGLAEISNGLRKQQLLEIIKLGMDHSIVGYEDAPKTGLIGINGGIIHHNGHHISYASYSYGPILQQHIDFLKSGITSPLTRKTIVRLRDACLAWNFSSVGGYLPLPMQMRMTLPVSPTQQINSNTILFPLLGAQLLQAFNGTPLTEDLQMAYSAIAQKGEGSSDLPIEWRSLTLPANIDFSSPLSTASLQGHLSHSMNGACLHRDGENTMAVRAANNSWRGGEGYTEVGHPHHFHHNSTRSALYLYTESADGRQVNEADSGYLLHGWDQNFYPNVTTSVIPEIDFLYWRAPGYYGGDSNFNGYSSLRESGAFMSHSVNYHKSGFMIGNRGTFVTDFIVSAAHTGLMQHVMTDPAAQAVTVNGTSYDTMGEWSFPDGGGHTLTDINGNGYYVHAQAENPPLVLKRQTQSWTYGRASDHPQGTKYFKKVDFVANRGDFVPSSGEASVAYFDHRANPANASVEFSVLMKPAAGELDNFVAEMANPASSPIAVTRSEKVHRYFDRASGTHSVAVFDPSELIDTGSLLSVDHLGSYTWKEDGDSLDLSFGRSNFNDLTPFVIVLSGKWQPESFEDTFAPKIEFMAGGTSTKITAPFRKTAPQRIKLRRIAPAAPSWMSLPPSDASDLMQTYQEYLAENNLTSSAQTFYDFATGTLRSEIITTTPEGDDAVRVKASFKVMGVSLEHRLEYSDSLIAGDWKPVAAEFAPESLKYEFNGNYTIEYLVPNNPTGQQRFFRMAVRPPVN